MGCWGRENRFGDFFEGLGAGGLRVGFEAVDGEGEGF